ncbi:MAG TPA: ATP-binding protein [Magnetospirillum sp.]|nr:ATP-binding protein [Magnetospirillum sp.]
MQPATFSLRARLLTLAVVAMAPVALLWMSAIWGLTGYMDRLSPSDAAMSAQAARDGLQHLANAAAIGLTIALTLSLIIAGTGLHRLVLRKVAALEAAATRIRAGEMGVTTGLADDCTELGRLARTFDSMASALDLRMKAYQHTLRESETRFRQMAGVAPTGIFRVDPSMRLTYVNPWFLGLMGRREGDLLGRSWLNCLHPDDLPWVAQIVVRAQAGEVELELPECRIVRPDGTEVWVLVRDIPEHDAHGHVTGRIGTMVEVTALKRVTEALRESEDRFRVALKHSRVAVCAYDRDLRYTWMFNGPPGSDNACGKRPDQLYDAEGARKLVSMQHEVLATGIGQRDTVRLVCAGQPLVFDVWYEPFRDPRGAIAGLVGAAVDITAERQLHAALIEAREQAERANDAKSRFLAAASHDLRQPFQAMRLFRAALSPYLTDPRADTVATKLDEAMNAGEQLLNTLLDVSTLEAGIVAPKPIPISAAELMARLAREFQPQVEGRGLRFKVVMRPALILTDPVLLERMLRNLVHNAVRYTEKGGILIGARRRGNQLVFQVVDTGVGIPPSQQDKVFEDFYQIGNPSRDRSQGLGLGLSVVIRMARLLGHPVDLQSVPGRGSIFSISVPLLHHRDQVAA